jgi:protein phosphatase
MSDIRIPGRALVALVGPAGSGKSRFAARHFRPTEVLSSDRLRAMISDDEADQSVSPQAFEILNLLARRRLEAGRLAVVDATSVTPEARRALLDVARECGAPALAVVLDVPEETCARNAAARAERPVAAEVVAAHAEALARSLPAIGEEGWDRVYVLDGAEAVERARVARD